MTRARAVNVKHEKCDAYMGREMPGYAASTFRNIFKVGRDGSKSEVLDKYRKHLITLLESNPAAKQEFEQLRGKTLGCWCKPNRCHVDIIVELLEGPEDLKELTPPLQGSLF